MGKNVQEDEVVNAAAEAIAQIRLDGNARQRNNVVNNDAGCYRCETPGCKTCSYVLETKTFSKLNIEEEPRSILQRLTCVTPRVIFLINCLHCKKQFVGYTNNSIKDNYESIQVNIKYKQTYYGEHFKELKDEGKFEENFQLIVIEQVPKEISLVEKRAEWVMILNTLKPNGLNKRES